MSLQSTLAFIANHPLNRHAKWSAVWRFFRWQMVARSMPYPFIYSFTDKARLVIRKGMAGATGNYYCGLHDFEEMGFLLHLLRPGDLFADIGANIGSYSILASAHCGSRTICFEPAPSTFQFLSDNIAINTRGGKIQAMHAAVGAAAGTVHFTTNYDSINHVALQSAENTVEVPVVTLDEQLQTDVPILMKIDVEGYELPVLQGAARLLSDPGLRAIIIEINGSGAQFGFADKAIHQLLQDHGFAPYAYAPLERRLTSTQGNNDTNTLYLRDIPFLQQRIEQAPPVTILGTSF